MDYSGMFNVKYHLYALLVFGFKFSKISDSEELLNHFLIGEVLVTLSLKLSF